MRGLQERSQSWWHPVSRDSTPPRWTNWRRLSSGWPSQDGTNNVSGQQSQSQDADACLGVVPFPPPTHPGTECMKTKVLSTTCQFCSSASLPSGSWNGVCDTKSLSYTVEPTVDRKGRDPSNPAVAKQPGVSPPVA